VTKVSQSGDFQELRLVVKALWHLKDAITIRFSPNLPIFKAA
jgi:hypothetical protein